MTLVVDPEACGHLGAGFGPLADAHLGLFYEDEDVTDPLPLPNPFRNLAVVDNSYFAPSGGGSPGGFGGGGGGGYYRSAIERQLPLQLLEHAAGQVPALSRTERLRTWTSVSLSAASQAGQDVTQERVLAQVLLKSAQSEDFILAGPLVRATHLAAAYTAVGLPTALVLHTPTRFVVTVWIGDRWHYADPSSRFDLDEHAAFEEERFASVPNLPPPATATDAPSDWRQQLDGLKTEMETWRAAVAKWHTEYAAWQQEHAAWEKRQADWQRRYTEWAVAHQVWEQEQDQMVAPALADWSDPEPVVPVSPGPPPRTTWIWWTIGLVGVAALVSVAVVALADRRPRPRKKRQR
jgi:hypothetical protein